MNTFFLIINSVIIYMAGCMSALLICISDNKCNKKNALLSLLSWLGGVIILYITIYERIKSKNKVSNDSINKWHNLWNNPLDLPMIKVIVFVIMNEDDDYPIPAYVNTDDNGKTFYWSDVNDRVIKIPLYWKEFDKPKRHDGERI